MHTTEGVWLSITDYSRYKGLSISTIRRRIKSNHIKFREEEGKYLIYVANYDKVKLQEEGEMLALKLENQRLKKQVEEIEVENAELKMLVSLYEKQAMPDSRSEEPPEFLF